jgi:hypothetical protein
VKRETIKERREKREQRIENRKEKREKRKGRGGKRVNEEKYENVGRLMDYSICRLLYVVFVCVSLYHTIP